MINLFEFLYYCMFRVFRSLKREDQDDRRDAATLYPVMLWTNFMLIAYLGPYLTPKEYFRTPAATVVAIVIFVFSFITINIFCRLYFLKWHHANKIIEKYRGLPIDDATAPVVIGVLYFFLSPAIFVGLQSFLRLISSLS